VKIDFYLHTLEDLDDLRHNIVTYETEDKGIELEGWDEISWKVREIKISLFALEIRDSKEIKKWRGKGFLDEMKQDKLQRGKKLNWIKNILDELMKSFWKCWENMKNKFSFWRISSVSKG